MMNFGRTGLLALGLLAGCDATGTVKDDEVTLAPGQTVQAEGGLGLRFDTVREDSRCAIDVVCVHEGNARLKLTIVQPSGTQASVDLNSRFEPRSVTRGEFTVELAGLKPDPRSTVTIDPQDYRATLRITRR